MMISVSPLQWIIIHLSTCFPDVTMYCKNSPQCNAVAGAGGPPLQPIPAQRSFYIFGIDTMDLHTKDREEQRLEGIPRFPDKMADGIFHA